MYKQGVVYIWQNQVGDFSIFNGTETEVISDMQPPDAESDNKPWWWTSLDCPEDGPDWHMIAFAGDLREKESS